MKLTRTRVWYVIITLTTIILGASLPALDAHASTIANSNEGLALGAGQLSVGSVVNGALSGVVNSSIQGTYPQATWTDTTGSGAGWQGSIAVTTAVYTGTWAAQGSAPSLASTSAGGYTGTTDGLQITVSVGSGGSSTSTPFTWTDNNGGSGSGSATNGTAVAVEDGITISFASGTTYPSGAQYMVDTGAQSTSSLELLSSSASVAATSGTISPAPTLVNSTAAVVAGGAATYGTSVSFVSSVTDTGMGSYTIAPGVDVVVDSSSWAAVYTAQAQYTIASGPGSAPATASSGSTATTLDSAQTSLPAATNYSYNGTADSYTVPSGVSLLQVTTQGAAGQGGGGGGEVSAVISVSAGQEVWAYMGQQPSNAATGGLVSNAPGGFGLGGSGASGPDLDAAGGGATSVFLTSSASSTPNVPTASDTGSLVEVAGAGGGAGGAGGNPGLNGSGGDGATQAAGGSGTLSGSFGLGGSSQPSDGYFPGGGGGGGFYGGGAGVGSNSGYGGGGGGGASWAASSAHDVSYTTGVNTGSGSASLQPVGALSPSNLTGSYDSSTGAVNLSWTASPSNGVLGYAVFRNGTEIGTTTGTNFADTSAPANTMVSYGVEALTSGLPSSQITTSVYVGTYSQAVLADSPTAYWQLNDTSGTTAVDSSGNDNNGTYTGSVTQGVSGPLLSATSVTAASFGGGWVTLPSGILQPTTETLEVWFKTTSSGGVLGMQSTTAGTTPASHVPVIYVGSDGLLRAEVWQGQVAPITSSTAVNNGQWQFAALVVSPSSQSLYLNGQLVGTLGGTVQPSGMTYNQIGWAYTSGWTAGASGSDPFSGTIGQTAVFPSDLTQAQLSSQYTAAGY